MSAIRRRGFSLLELMVVIAVIGILAAILIPTLRRARLAGQQVRASSDLRQLLISYIQYHTENRGAVLFGYTPPTVNGKAVIVSDPVSLHTFGYPIADRYPWRLLPYCSGIWGILHSHNGVPPLPARSDSPSVAHMKAYTLSIDPTFGINSIFVGGHAGAIFKGFAGPNGDSPNSGRHVVFRASEVKQPWRLIVFAESQTRNMPSTEPDSGLHFVTPPRAAGQRWTVVNGSFSLTTGMIVGLPKGRFGSRTITGFFDGHVESLPPSELEDMRLWSAKANHSKWDF